MTIIKSFSDLQQSKKLAEILPLESADMCFPHIFIKGADTYNPIPECAEDIDYPYEMPCWSLAALLGVLPNKIGRYYKTLGYFDNNWYCTYMDEDSECVDEGTLADNPVDACYEMIIRLNELNLLKLWKKN